MRKLILFVGLMLMASVVQAQVANISKIDVDFNRKVALIYISSGTGTTFTVEIDESAFDTMVAQLTAANALNLPVIQSSLIAMLSAPVPPTLTTNVNWDNVASILTQGGTWANVKSANPNVNWQAVVQINGLTGINWTTLTGINWQSWPTYEAQGQNWEQFITTNGQ